MREKWLFLMGALVLAGCADDEVGTDTPSAVDSAVASDTGTSDGAPADSSVADSSAADSSAADSSVADSSATDSSAADSGAADSSVADSSAADSGATDGGTKDSAIVDSGPADTGAVADVGTTSFMSDIQPIFTANCTGCHSGSAASAGLNLSSAYAALVNVASNCDSTVKRVTPGSTTNSMLWRKLANDAAKCGGAMPLGTAGLKTTNPAAFAKVEAWIREGALNN